MVLNNKQSKNFLENRLVHNNKSNKRNKVCQHKYERT